MSRARARQLRKTMTPQEVRLWSQLRHFNRQGFHFRRQVPIGRYIVDFAEFGQRLIIEVDGSQHGFEKGEAADRIRDEQLTLAGFRVLRFWNNDVDRNMDGVVDTVQAALPPSVSPGARPAEPPSPQGGRIKS
ncbi:endonuclease domain-containing protein [Nordella sp. HKS 07]|nr:endonuclease domain-containing protein [Nordella sp. HKS 07]